MEQGTELSAYQCLSVPSIRALLAEKQLRSSASLEMSPQQLVHALVEVVVTTVRHFQHVLAIRSRSASYSSRQ